MQGIAVVWLPTGIDIALAEAELLAWLVDKDGAHVALWPQASPCGVTRSSMPAASVATFDSRVTSDGISRLPNAGTEDRRFEHLLGVFDRGKVSLEALGFGSKVLSFGKSVGCQRLSASTF